jgi:hypothetical protein
LAFLQDATLLYTYNEVQEGSNLQGIGIIFLAKSSLPRVRTVTSLSRVE